MPSWLVVLGKTAGSALLSMAAALVTERMIKKIVIALLEQITIRTKSPVDDQLLAEARKEWEKDDGVK